MSYYRLLPRRHDHPRALPTWQDWLLWAIALLLVGVALPWMHHLACVGRIGWGL